MLTPDDPLKGAVLVGTPVAFALDIMRRLTKVIS